MNRNVKLKLSMRKMWFVLVLLFVVLSGCSQQAQMQPVADADVYTGALDVTYEDALDPTSQLALGILELAGTPDAVTADQSAVFLTLWQALQGTTVKGDAERNAVVSQIEGTLRETQVSAIQSMRLTNTGALMWLQAQGNGAVAGGNQGSQAMERPADGNTEMTEEQRAEMREQFANMSDAEKATQQERFVTASTSPVTSGGVSSGLIRGVIALLEDSVAQTSDLSPAGDMNPSPTPTLAPTATKPAETAESDETQDMTPAPSPTPEVKDTVVHESPPEQTVVSGDVAHTVLAQPVPVSGQASMSQVVVPPALAQIQDTDPGPPFSVEVTTNFAVPNPDLEDGWIYTVGGFVRNDSDQTYSLSAIHVTFYDADGFRGAFYPFASTGGRRVRGGEWIWHGRTEADYACLLLAPGQACPFSVQIAALDMGSFLIHPDAAVVEWHEATTAELRDVTLIEEGTGYVRISGTVHNNNAYKIKHVMVSGALLDAAGQMVSFGTVTLLEEDIELGAGVHFDVRIKKTSYVDYALYVSAEGDFD